jgi:hypothetical protein
LMPTSSVPSVLLTSPIAAKMLSKGICGRGVGSEMVRAPEVERDTSSGVTTCDESSQAANIPPRTIVIEPSTTCGGCCDFASWGTSMSVRWAVRLPSPARQDPAHRCCGPACGR